MSRSKKPAAAASGGLFGGHRAELLEALGGALLQHLGRIGAGLGGDRGDLAAVIDALFEHLLGVIGVLGDPVLGRDRLRRARAAGVESLRRSRASARSGAAPAPARLRRRAGWPGSAPRYCGAAPPRSPRHRRAGSGNRRTSWSRRNRRSWDGHQAWRGFRSRASGFVQCTIAYIGQHSAACQGHIIFVQRSNFRLRRSPRGSRRSARAVPALDAAQPAVERRHRRREIRRFVAQPDPRTSPYRPPRSALPPRMPPRPSPGMPAASSIQRIERSSPAPAASAASGSAGNSRPQHLDRGAVRGQRVETPHQQIEHPVARALVGLGFERGGQHRLVDAAEKPAQDRRLRREHAGTPAGSAARLRRRYRPATGAASPAGRCRRARHR